MVTNPHHETLFHPVRCGIRDRTSQSRANALADARARRRRIDRRVLSRREVRHYRERVSTPGTAGRRHAAPMLRRASASASAARARHNARAARFGALRSGARRAWTARADRRRVEGEPEVRSCERSDSRACEQEARAEQHGAAPCEHHATVVLRRDVEEPRKPVARCVVPTQACGAQRERAAQILRIRGEHREGGEPHLVIDAAIVRNARGEKKKRGGKQHGDCPDSRLRHDDERAYERG